MSILKSKFKCFLINLQNISQNYWNVTDQLILSLYILFNILKQF